MAKHLASIFGTEEDRVNCPFYFKIGACRNGDQCNRVHNRPASSPTVLLKHMYPQPPAAIAMAEGQDVNDDIADQAQDHFEAFYEEVWLELCNYGELEDIGVTDNISDHMLGNVYVKFVHEESAEVALTKLQGRFYGGRACNPELSPVTDFKEPRCRQYEEAMCGRGGYCNFIHWKYVPKKLKRSLRREMYDEHPEFVRGGGRDRGRDGGRGERRRSRSARGEHGGGGGGAEAPPKRQTSEERRAMIESWNQERGA